MHRLKHLILLFYLLMVFISCQCKLSLDDNLEDNHIEVYHQIENLQNKKITSTTPKPAARFSIFHKRTRPASKRSNRTQLFSSTPNDRNEATNQQPAVMMRLNKSKASAEFVDIYDGNLNRQNINNNQYDNVNHDVSNKNSSMNSSNSFSSEVVENVSHTQQLMLAFEHGMKREAKCQTPKPTVVYLNQDKEHIKIYMPRATILYRCGQNTGCCESESDHCVAIEQQQVNLYFFVIKLEKDSIQPFDDSLSTSDYNSKSISMPRRGRKFNPLDPNSNEDGQLKEYEYNLDYSMTGDNEQNTFKLNESDGESGMQMFNELKNENTYLSALLGQDDVLKRRFTRSKRSVGRATSNRRKSKDLSIDHYDSSDKTSFKTEQDISITKRNLSDDGESNVMKQRFTTNGRMNSKRPLFVRSQSSRQSNNGNENHINRSLGGQMRPRQTIEMLTFTNHTRCGCVKKMM